MVGLGWAYQSTTRGDYPQSLQEVWKPGLTPGIARKVPCQGIAEDRVLEEGSQLVRQVAPQGGRGFSALIHDALPSINDRDQVLQIMAAVVIALASAEEGPVHDFSLGAPPGQPRHRG